MNPDHVSSSPDLYPVRFSSDLRKISFIRMTRASYQHSSFLDHRIWRVSPEEYDTDTNDLTVSAHEGEHAGGPPYYILHPAYSCSTLLARYLELIPYCFVLKEPDILTRLAVSMPEAADDSSSWTRMLTVILRLLGRSYRPGESVIIKASDCCTILGDLLLRHDTRSRIVILSIALETFLPAVLKSPERRRWLRHRLKIAHGAAKSFPELAAVDPLRLSDAQGAAWLWLIHENIRECLQDTGASRVMSLDGEQIAQSPKIALRAVGRHFGLIMDEDRLDCLVNHNSARTHSKNGSVPYDLNSRAAEFAVIQNELRQEIEEGTSWLANRFGRNVLRLKSDRFTPDPQTPASP